MTEKRIRPGITGIGIYQPIEVRTNHYFETRLGTDTANSGTTDAWIRERTGIRSRRVAAPDQNTSDLAVEAAKGALDMAQLKPSDLDQIIVATATPDYYSFPATANLLLRKLDAGSSTSVFDLGNACNGFIAAMRQAYSLVRSGDSKNVLVIGAELFSRFIDYQDRNTCVLFGDGAGAVVIGRVDNPGPGIFITKSDGSGASDLMFPGGGSVHPASLSALEARLFTVKMKSGRSVFYKAVNYMAEVSKEVLKRAEIGRENVSCVIPHQANSRIIEALAQKMELTDKAIDYIHDMGNISAASIPSAMFYAYRDGWIQPGDHLLLAAIGAGLNYGAGVDQWHLPSMAPRPEGTFAEFRARQLASTEISL